MSSGQLTKRWRIEFENGFVIECYSQRKPTRLANSWTNEMTCTGSVYGKYTIVCQGLFNKQIVRYS